MTEPTTWHAEAACRKFDPTAWETPNNNQPTALNAEAIEICNACPVRAACLSEAMALEKGWGMSNRWHVWGGLMPTERAELDKGPRRTAHRRVA